MEDSSHFIQDLTKNNNEKIEEGYFPEFDV